MRETDNTNDLAVGESSGLQTEEIHSARSLLRVNSPRAATSATGFASTGDVVIDIGVYAGLRNLKDKGIESVVLVCSRHRRRASPKTKVWEGNRLAPLAT